MMADEPVDLRRPEDLALARRIGISWIAIRRGAQTSGLRELLLGTGDDALEQGQMDTLDLLAVRPAWRMSDIADALRVEPSTATRAVQRLVNAGLAERRADDADGRVVLVEITPAGRHRHSEVAVRRGRLMQHLLEAYSAAERPVLAEFLERFVATVDDFLAQVHDPVS